MASYFNIDKETDWAIFGGMYGDTIWNNFNVYSSYKNCLQSDDWITPDSLNQRIITDQQFSGIGNIINSNFKSYLFIFHLHVKISTEVLTA
jgi:hypothetical protein